MSDNLYEYYTTSPYIKGDVGEVVIASELRDKCNIIVLRNLYFPADTHFTEVDIVAISSKGVFIIESKNYKGEVTGGLNDKYWSVRYSVSHTERLYNPILQNKLHLVAVKSYLYDFGITDIPIFKPVIFSNKSKLKLRDCEKSVFTLDNFINKYNNLDIELISSDTIDKLVSLFKPLSNQSYEMRLLHLSLLDRKESC